MVVWVAFLLHDNGGGVIILITRCDKQKESPKNVLVKLWTYSIRIVQKYRDGENRHLFPI